MKLFGNKRSSKHTASGHDSAGGGNRRQAKKKNLPLRIAAIVLSVIAVLVIVVLTSIRPPEVINNKGWKPNSEGAQQPSVPGNTNNATRTGGKYTFLILGTDDGNGNTDTMMVATLDTSDYTLNVVSIPRDTLVNVSWSVKKVNSLYGAGGIDRVLSGVSELLGYEVDFYALVDLDAFVKLVDAIGGVYYDVPVNMYYNDPAQNLYINIAKGPQHLDGEDAVKVVRFRNSYANGDIGRIDTQQDFLKTMAEQILENKDSIPLTTLADVFLKNVKTDLAYGNVIWFAKECMKLDSENITFQKLPGNYNDWINGSYVTIYVDEWLEMINTYLNPFNEPIEESDLNILTRNSSGQLYSTSGIYAGNPSWGSGSSRPSGGSSYTPPETNTDPVEPVEPSPDPDDPNMTDPDAEDPNPDDPVEENPNPDEPGIDNPDPDDPGTEEPGTSTGEIEPGDAEMGDPQEAGSSSASG